MLTGVSLMVVIDLWMVDKRWVNNDIVKDQNGKEVKDKDGNPLYQIWTKADQNDKPHEAGLADYLIYENEIKANPSIAKNANEKINLLQKEKKEKGGGNTSVLPAESDYILFGELNLNTNYRVINTTAALDQDGRTCYFHKSLGGYHGAKLVRIQDVIDFQLGKEQQMVRMSLNAGTIPGIDSALKNFPVINMMNTKYIILDPEGQDVDEDGVPDGFLLDLQNPQMAKGMPSVLANPHACGNAWFVSNIKWVKNADEEILALGKFDPKTTAIIDEREKEKLGGLTPSADPSASVKMEKYKANQIIYTSKSSKKNLLVFSEIYYPAGWKVLVDGNETGIIRVNYLLRAIVLEPGNHKIEMVYEPSSYYSSKPISLVASLSVIGLMFFAFYKEWKEQKAA